MPLFDTIQATLQAREPLPPLFPDAPYRPDLSCQLAAESDAQLFGPSAGNDGEIGGAAAVRAACRAGLLLWNDDLQASHHIAQNIEDATGSFWHAIMHRREGDAANANYWWRKTGAHPAFADVRRAALNALRDESNAEAQSFAASLERAGTWQPSEFTARCAQAGASAQNDLWLRRVQLAEMQALLDWCQARIG